MFRNIVEDGFDILKIASCSFTDWPLLGSPHFNGLANYRALADDPQWLDAVSRSLKFTLLYVPTTVALGLSALRYPVLWERIAPDALDAPDWRWTDQRLPLGDQVRHRKPGRFPPLPATSF